MNRPKFSSGPWQHDGRFVWNDPKYQEDSRVLTRICKVDSYHIGGGSGHANVRLIAAAPDLYDIAFQLVCIGDGMDTGTLPDIIKDARAALEKIGAEPEVEE